MPTAISRRSLLSASRLLLAGAAVGAIPGRARAQAPRQQARPAASGAAARLSANENPYGPGPAAREAIQQAINDSWKYSFGEEMALKKLIAEREGLTTEHVILGDGSSEILHIAGVLYGLDRGEIIHAHPTFAMVADYAKEMQAGIQAVPLDGEMRHDLKAMSARISKQTRLIYICNPNNPTGTLLPGPEIRDFIATVPREAAVFVDEAYLDLSDDMAAHTALPRVQAGDNVIVTRTFSKLHGLAGLRIGYGLARPDIIQRMERLKLPVLGTLGVRAATASYQDLEFQAGSRKRIAEGVAVTVGALDELKIRYAPTRANFVFFDTGKPAGQFLAAMRQRGFSLGRPFPPYDTWCRVSMGRVEQMQAFAGALRAHFAA
jgi:histidinol-phosphate aminotransferase